MKTSDFDYTLPSELIAQHPADDRTHAKMMVINRQTGEIRHERVANISTWLNSGDLLVVNNTRVIPARLFGFKDGSGGKVEVLLIEEIEKDIWYALMRMSGTASIGTRVSLGSGKINAQIIARRSDGKVTLQLKYKGNLPAILEKEGVSPLPPYIRRSTSRALDRETPDLDKTRYQTVYAKIPGAVAAPTAGLHFTPELLDDLKKKGVQRAAITLHVGIGTFKPVQAETIENHIMDEERYCVSSTASGLIRKTRQAGGRITAVGTTVVRTLETAALESGYVPPGCGRSALFITPPYSFKAVDVLLTNFHLPKSTLLMLVSAFAGTDLIRHAYSLAIERRYRFYSYGDCMLIV